MRWYFNHLVFALAPGPHKSPSLLGFYSYILFEPWSFLYKSGSFIIPYFERNEYLKNIYSPFSFYCIFIHNIFKKLWFTSSSPTTNCGKLYRNITVYTHLRKDVPIENPCFFCYHTIAQWKSLLTAKVFHNFFACIPIHNRLPFNK